MKPHIPVEEFHNRVSKARAMMKQQNIDILFAYGNETEPQYQKYFSNFWPAFETAAVIFAQEGAPLLLVGPESQKRASELQIIEDVRSIAAFRESSSPEYNGIHLDSFYEIINQLTGGSRPEHVAIAGSRLLPFDIYKELKENLEKYGEVQIHADTIVDTLRTYKSENEIACIQRACNITAKTMYYLLDNIRPGMTELQVKGLALGKMFELGAEGEAFPIWVLSGRGIDYAIGRARQKTIQPGELVQLQIGARYEGYASTIARPIIIGQPEQWMKDSINALYDGYNAVLSKLSAEDHAKAAAIHFSNTMKRNGYYNQTLYGPCHGLGTVECEAPWIEEGSDFLLSKGMTFGMDLYIENHKKQYGMRVEDTICITDEKPLNMTNFPRELYILS